MDNGKENNEYPVEIYIDKMLLDELEPHRMNIVVDVKTWKRFGTQKQSLSLNVEH